MDFSILADAAAAVDPSQTPAWLQVVILVINALIASVLIPFLRAKAVAADAEAEASTHAGNLSAMEARQLLSERLKSFMLRTAGNFAEKRWPVLATRIVGGELRSSEAIKAELRAWGKDLKKDAIEYFAAQGIDLVEAYGDKYLDNLIEWAANKTSPFPGKESAIFVLKNNVSNMLVAKGVEHMKNWSMSEEAQ